jgi:hypothetical protein
MGVPPDGKAVDAKVLLPNVPFQTNVTNLPAEFAQVFLDSRLQMNLCVQAARRTADADHQAKGTKERYDLQRKEKH